MNEVTTEGADIHTERTFWDSPILIQRDGYISYYLAHTSDGKELVLLVTNVTGVFVCPRNWVLV